MPDFAAIVYRRAELRKRMNAAVATLQERHTIPEPRAFPKVKDKEVKELQEYERLVLIMEALVGQSATPVAEGT